VRFIGNYSTGKMGFALCEELASRGAKVILICGPVNLEIKHPNICRIDVISADEMFEACMQHFPACDGAIMTAAVADYAPLISEKEKIKRQEGNLIMELRPSRDIAAELGRIKRVNQVMVGFALESQNEMENAISKLKRKNLDMIVLNSLKDTGAGFGHDTNKITIISRTGKIYHYELKSKLQVAADIVDCILEL
jgi:phosphopantothenoylcysteine decarboxylase / phosphopantothenate---cysteine ligase